MIWEWDQKSPRYASKTQSLECKIHYPSDFVTSELITDKMNRAPSESGHGESAAI